MWVSLGLKIMMLVEATGDTAYGYSKPRKSWWGVTFRKKRGATLKK